MERGDIYRVKNPSRIEPKKFRTFVVVSRRKFILSNYKTVICAPIYTNRSGLPTEVYVGIDEGLKHDSCVRCDELISIEKSKLTNFIGKLSAQKLRELNQSLKIALEIED